MQPLRYGRVCLCLSSLMANSLATECGARTYFFCRQDAQQHCLQFTHNASPRDTFFDPKVHTCSFFFIFLTVVHERVHESRQRGPNGFCANVTAALMFIHKKKSCVHAHAIFGASFSSDSALFVPPSPPPRYLQMQASESPDRAAHRQTRRRLRISFILESL